MQKTLYAAAIFALTAAVAAGCATRKFVRTEVGTQVGEVNDKVTTVATALEGTQQRTSENTARIGVVDAKADGAVRSATDARAAADAAATATTVVDARLTGRVNGVEQAAQADRKLIYSVTLSEGQGNFKSNGAVLPDDVKARLDEMVGALKTDPKTVFIEIEGHTDNQGEALYNEHLGMERAEMVKRYLYEQHQVPLHKINVISYGEAKPVAPNTNRQGRAQNRRVVVRVLS